MHSPWNVEEIIARGGNMRWMVRDIEGDKITHQYSEAKARLIAAAPDLLDALERLQDHHCSGLCDCIPEEDHMTVMEQVSQAIEKAKCPTES